MTLKNGQLLIMRSDSVTIPEFGTDKDANVPKVATFQEDVILSLQSKLRRIFFL